MNEHISHPVEPANNKASLAERLDPSIGELSSVMGAIMTELLRRTLRDSVRQIDDELQGRAAQKLDATIAHRLPSIEQSASEAAAKTARETASDVAGEKVRALEQRAQETERDIVSRITTTARTAEQQTTETANALTGKIEQAEKKAELAITSQANELTNRIEETAKTAISMTEEKALEMARQIEDAERRATVTAQAETARQIEDLLQRTRKTTTGIRDRLQVMETTAENLKKQIQEHRTAEGQLRVELAEASKRNAALDARVTELEKPRGLRALWAWLFGRREKEARAPILEADGAEEAGQNPDRKMRGTKSAELSNSEPKGARTHFGKGS